MLLDAQISQNDLRNVGHLHWQVCWNGQMISSKNSSPTSKPEAEHLVAHVCLV